MIKRKETRTLLPDELQALRAAMAEFQANGDQNCYHDIAGYHGIPHHYCHEAHRDPSLFLAWHRYYIYFFEKELRKIDSRVSIPYWNWADENTFNDSLSPAHKDPTFIDTAGVTRKNPLFSALIDDKSRETHRAVDLSPTALRTAMESLSFAYDYSVNFFDFNVNIDAPHQSIHVLVGGDFKSVDRAAYDPLFWSYHATVDRQWAIWQKRHPDVAVPDDILNVPLPGFEGKNVGDVIDYQRQLEYEYDNLEVPSKDNYVPVVLKIKGIQRTEQAFRIEVFLKNLKSVKRIMAGIFGIFGMGKMKPDHLSDHSHHPMLFDEFVDVTEAIKKLEAHKEDVKVEFVVKDENAKIVDTKIFRYKSFEITKANRL